MNRERLGRIVREVWIAWAKEQPNPKSSWLVEWPHLSEPDKEVDRRIGETLFRLGFNHKALNLPELRPQPIDYGQRRIPPMTTQPTRGLKDEK